MSNRIEFEYEGNTYDCERFDAFRQGQLLRRLTPLLTKLGGALSGFSKIGELMASPEVLQPFAEELASMPDDRYQWIIETCIGAVRQRAGDSWTPIWNKTARRYINSDLDNLAAQMRFVWEVCRANLGPSLLALFTNSAPTESPAVTRQ
jgi:hypothetical protein